MALRFGFRTALVLAVSIAGALVLAGAFLVPTDEGQQARTAIPEDARTPMPTSDAIEKIPAAVAGYLVFVDRPPYEPGVDPRYASEGARRLAAALDAVVLHDVLDDEYVQGDIDRVRRLARDLEAPGPEGERARLVREVGLAATRVMRVAGQVHGENGDRLNRQIQRTADAARSLDPDRPLPEQTEHVQELFARAADAVRSLTTRT